MPDPKLSHRLWISETAHPSASAVTRAIVSPDPWRCPGIASGNVTFPDPVGEAGQVPVVEERRGMDAHRVRVRQVMIAITVRGREYQRQQVRVGTERIGVDAQPFDEREDLQQREPLAVRRHHPHVDISIASAERRADVRRVRGEVVHGDR